MTEQAADAGVAEARVRGSGGGGAAGERPWSAASRHVVPSRLGVGGSSLARRLRSGGHRRSGGASQERARTVGAF